MTLLEFTSLQEFCSKYGLPPNWTLIRKNSSILLIYLVMISALCSTYFAAINQNLNFLYFIYNDKIEGIFPYKIIHHNNLCRVLNQLESLHKHDKNNLSTKISVIQDMLESLEKKLLDYKKVLKFLENSSHT